MARALTPPFYVGVTLPHGVYATHHRIVRQALRSGFEGLTSARNVIVRRGPFDIEIGLDAGVSMDFLEDVAEWRGYVQTILADNDINHETGELELPAQSGESR